MNKTVLECNGIAAGYVKDLNILQGVDLVVKEKEIVSIIGPNGAGKSTLLKAIMGLINVSGGRFYINGIEKTNLATYKIVNEGIGYVPQVANVFPSLTIEENLEIGSWSLNKQQKENLKQIYEQFSLLKDRKKDKAGNLSGGQRQILALARALITKPTLLLLRTGLLVSPTTGRTARLAATALATRTALRCGRAEQPGTTPTAMAPSRTSVASSRTPTQAWTCAVGYARPTLAAASC